MAAWRQGFAIFLALSMGACSRPYKTPVIEAMAPASREFTGLRSLEQGKPLKVLVVHGMCYHGDEWVKKWAAAMADTFGVEGVEQQTKWIGLIETRRYDFKGKDRNVEVTFAIWSWATSGAKGALAFDDPPWFPYKRAALNEAGKSGLINACFSDPVIYSGSRAPGSIGAGIRRDMAGVVCEFLGGRWADQACTGGDAASDRAFITESLGSKILLDAVDHVASRDSGVGAPLQAALSQTRAMYMLANQLPLLRLAEIPEVQAERVETPELRWLGPSQKRVEAAEGTGAQPLQVIAFTDPNDFFSYRLTYPSLGEQPGRITLFNVIVSNAKTYLGLAENPYPAHTGYWDNPEVPALVLNGGSATE